MTKFNLLVLGLLLGFIAVGFVAYQNAKPEDKSERVYKEIKPYMPYYLEKRFGGLSIVSKITGKKEKPPASQLYKRLDQLEKMWGNEFLKISGDDLIITDKNGTEIGKIKLLDSNEKAWVKSFFELK